MNSLPQCPTNLLPCLLDESLTLEQMTAIERHLETCEQCRKDLENESGEKSFWSNVASLSDDELDRDWIAFTRKTADEDDGSDGRQANERREEKLRIIFQSIKHLLSPSDDPYSVGRIGNYEVTGLIGSGGMGVVLKANDPLLDRVVAIKVLAPHLSAFEIAKTRFLREAKAAAAVQHDGIIPIYGVDTHRDTPYFVMPYEVGPSLQQRIEQDGKLTIEESLRVASQIAAALSAAHQIGLVHRDIKPSNILLAPGTERALLTDFGLAQAGNGQTLTETGLLAGTPMFMSPEQARGENVDGRSDLFSLGSVLFMMLTGQPPSNGETTYEIVRKIGGDPMPRLHDVDPSIPHWLDLLISRLHENETDKRIQTAEETKVLLNDCLAHLQNPAENKISSSLIPSAKDRKPGLNTVLLLSGIAVAIFTVGLIGGWWPVAYSGPNRKQPQLDAESSIRGESSAASDLKSEFDWDDGLDESIDEIHQRITAIENEDNQ